MPFRKRRLSSAFLMGAQEHFPARRLILSLLLRITTRRQRTNNPTSTIILLRANQVEPPRVWRRLQSLRRWSHNEEVNEVLSRSPRACRAHGVRGAPRIQLAVGGNPGHCPKIGCTTQRLCNWVRRMNVIPGSATGSARPRHGASRSWSARFGNSSGSTRSYVWQALFSPRRSSTATGSREGVHRRAQGPFRGRADLQSPAGCPVDVLAECRPAEEPGPALPARTA